MTEGLDNQSYKRTTKDVERQSDLYFKFWQINSQGKEIFELSSIVTRINMDRNSMNQYESF